MKIEHKGHTVIVHDTQNDVVVFLEKVIAQYDSFRDFNILLDVSKNANIKLQDIKLFDALSKTHKKFKKSFVIVAANLDFNKITAKISVVPSLQEAHDTIEMEEIERDLGF